MKRNYTLLGFLMLSNFAFSQTNVLNTTGNVGIGTLSPESGFIFDVNGLGTIGTQANARLYLGTLDATHAFIQSRNYSINQNLTFLAKSFNFNIGNVGIGVADPTAKLDVSGSMAIQSSLTNASARPALASTKIPGEIRAYSLTGYQADDGFLRLSAGAGTNPGVQSYIDLSGYSTIPDMNMKMVFGTNGTERIRILNSGNVGIGTAFPAEKLSVKGKIRAQEVKVEMANWADFVFAKDYALPTLQETETHIKEKGHLSGIPSAAEVEKNGIELGDMNKKLLQKIEELTLYLIKMNKTVEDQSAELAKQKEQINQLKKTIQ
jgi:hypothetical protein